MKLLRVGGRYLEGREQLLWAALVAVLGLALAGVVLAEVSLKASPVPMWAGITVVAVVTLSTAAKVARRLTSVRKGRLGERLVTDLLRRLPDDYLLLNDVVLDGKRGNVDHVLIGPCGVVIETKRIAGRIRCYGNEWSVNGHRRRSISQQVNSGACAVRYFLTERHPDLAATPLRWVESVVVFTHPTCRLEVNRARAAVVRYSELLQLILTLAEKHRMAPTVAARLAESLVASQAVSR